MSKLFTVFVGFILALFGVAVGLLGHGHRSTRGQVIIGPIEFNCSWNGVFPYTNCDQYVECWEDESNLWQCTDLQLFDLTYNGCNFAQYVDCQDRFRPTNVPSTLTPTVPTTTSNVSTTTTEGPSEEFNCPSDGVFAHEERCEYYWNCYAGVAQLIHCQLDFLFDLVYMGCNYPELTHCQDRARPPGVKPTINPPVTTRASTTQPPPTTEYTGPTTTKDPNVTTPSTTPSTTTETTQFVCPPGFEGDLADPDDCTAFYTCSGGIPYHNYCPVGLLFNPLYGYCDHPNNVEC